MHRTKVKVAEDALDANTTIANANRADFDRAGVRVVNLMSAPGAGKTTLLESVLGGLAEPRVGVLEGDVQGSMDADRLAHLHVPVVQINTDSGFGGECHLDANMVRSAIGDLPLADLDVLVVENVGNLVCPAEFRIGEDAKAMICSVTEGEDKPLKYPLMFRSCELVVINKIDLLEHLDFDLERFIHNVDSVNPDAERMLVSAKTGEGVEAFKDWLTGVAQREAAPATAGQRRDPDRERRHRVAALLERRVEANQAFFEAESERLARLCHAMAERFARGGRLVALGLSPQARSDVRHVTVEFVHPVIVGKRALPAIGLARDGGPLVSQVELVVEPDDIAIAFGADEAGGDEVSAALAAAREAGCLTLAFAPTGAEWELEPPSDDPFIRQELAETAYHVLWELVHVFFDHRGLLEGREAQGDPRHRPLELPLSVPRRGGDRAGAGRRGRPLLGRDEGRRDR